MFDLLLLETGDGGDLDWNGSDLVSTQTYEGLIYMALFSGGDFWGNYLFNEKIECKTEIVLRNSALNSAGRTAIESAIREDLSYLSKHLPMVNISVETKIVNIDRLHIRIRVDNLVYIYEYNGDKTVYIRNEEW